MTNFVSNYCLGPVAPMVQKDKGNAANRLGCTGAQTKEFAKTFVKAGAITTPILAAGHFIANAENAAPGKVQQYANKLFTTVYKKAKEVLNKDSVKDVLNSVKSMPPVVKGGLIVLAGLTCVGKAIAVVAGHKHMYTMGQIDQKYTDRAEQQEKQTPHQFPEIVY